MGTSIRTHVIKIGNSRGIRIPRLLLEQTELGDEVELEVRGDKLVVRSARSPRQGWDEQFAKMAEQGDDRLLDSEVVSSSSWDENEWEW